MDEMNLMKIVIEKKEKDPTRHHHWYNSVGDVIVDIDITGVLFVIYKYMARCKKWRN